ncbi:hypothetical protein EJB05_48147, partial [Eragrostis curvula]
RSVLPTPETLTTPQGCRRYCLPSRPATQAPIDIDIPGDPAIQTPPNFTSMCAMKSSTTYPKIASRSDTGRRGSNSQCRLLAVLDLSCAPDGTPCDSQLFQNDLTEMQWFDLLFSFAGVHGKREEGVLPNSGDGGVLLAKAQEGASEGRETSEMRTIKRCGDEDDNIGSSSMLLAPLFMAVSFASLSHPVQ